MHGDVGQLSNGRKESAKKEITLGYAGCLGCAVVVALGLGLIVYVVRLAWTLAS